jgi:hypothetical protein
MPSITLVHAIHEVGYELMLVGARVTDNATAEIIKDNGRLLTISIPGGLLPVRLTVDPPGAARLVQLLTEYAKRAKSAGLAHRLEKPQQSTKRA